MWTALIILFIVQNMVMATEVAGKELYYELHKTAKFRLFVPENVTFIRGVICVSDYHAGTHIYGSKLGYRKLAKSIRFAILKYYLGEVHEMYKKERYNDMISALEYFAAKTGYDELKYSKLVLTGLSYAGRQACVFAMYNPSRCIAIIVIHGAFRKKYGGLLAVNNAVCNIPGIFPIAQFDNITKDSSYHQVIKARKKGALWGAYIDPASRHPVVRNQQLNILWLKAVVNKRLPGHIPSNKDFPLYNIQKENGWLASLEYKSAGGKFAVTKAEIYPYKKYPYSKVQAQWLPSREVAESWLERNQGAIIKKTGLMKKKN